MAKHKPIPAGGKWITSVEDLVFYAIDKASPYNLALSPNGDSIDKIQGLKFTQLLIDKSGIGIMWMIINGGLPTLGGQAVSPADASLCKTAGDVYAAARKML